MKKLLILVLALAMVFAFAACGGNPQEPADSPAPADTPQDDAPADTPEPAEVITINFGNTVSATQAYGIACQNFGDILYELSGGTMQVVQFFDGQLGGDSELMEGLQLGTVQMTVIGPASLCNIVPEFSVLDLTCNFETQEAAYYFLDSDAGQELLNCVAAKNCGMVGLGYFENGYYQISNDKEPITKIDQLAGLQIRSMGSELQKASWTYLKAAPTVIAFNELYLALQTGTVDAQETTVSTFASSSFYDVQHYLTLSDRLYHVMTILAGDDFWNGLTQQQQGWIMEAIEQAHTQHRTDNEATTAALIESLQSDNGVTISTLEEGEWTKMKEMAAQHWTDTETFVNNPAFWTEFTAISQEANAAFPRDIK